jgi:outer membrane protein OmpA-like peptidoglycan-associated protein
MSTGCLATRNFVRENVQQSETKTGQELTRVEGQVTQARGVADAATKQATEATQLAGQAGTKADEAAQAAGRASNRAEEGFSVATQAQAKADQTDTRLTRLWNSRHKYAIVDTLVISFGFNKWQLDDRAETSLLEVVRQLNENPGYLHRIQTSGLGESRPTAANTTKQGRDQNRRVAIRLVTPSE